MLQGIPNPLKKKKFAQGQIAAKQRKTQICNCSANSIPHSPKLPQNKVPEKIKLTLNNTAGANGGGGLPRLSLQRKKF